VKCWDETAANVLDGEREPPHPVQQAAALDAHGDGGAADAAHQPAAAPDAAGANSWPPRQFSFFHGPQLLPLLSAQRPALLGRHARQTTHPAPPAFHRRRRELNSKYLQHPLSIISSDDKSAHTRFVILSDHSIISNFKCVCVWTHRRECVWWNLPFASFAFSCAAPRARFWWVTLGALCVGTAGAIRTPTVTCRIALF